MPNKGILLRKDIKSNLIAKPPKVGEIVFATDTDEVGSMSKGTLIWQDWGLSFPDPLTYVGDLFPESIGSDGKRYMFVDSGIIREFINVTGVWEEIIRGAEKTWLDDNLEPNNHSNGNFPYLGKYGYRMADGFITSVPYDVVTLAYLQSLPSANDGRFIRLDGSNGMDVGYSPTLDNDVVTLGHLLSGESQFVIPTINPAPISGALWNDNGILKISTGL